MTHTNTQQKAPRACDSKGLHTDTNNWDFRSHGGVNQAPDGNTITANLKAVCSRLKIVASGFYIDRGISAESILLLILMTVYLIWRAEA
jgi:hypothetical protein